MDKEARLNNLRFSKSCFLISSVFGLVMAIVFVVNEAYVFAAILGLMTMYSIEYVWKIMEELKKLEIQN
ncbi:MAG: hypothetical protein C9356_20335 [Oleiphilus sp.]|nr:MAG: hypothetical protein C9356_20335 [Oleiphilus sp.]